MEKAHETKPLDLTGAARGVWLVKVPKYLSEKWQTTPDGSEVGKLKISKPKAPGAKPEVIFSLTGQDALEASTIPKDHKFVLTGLANQNLCLMSRSQTTDAASQQPDEKVAVEGKVIQRAECRPMGDAKYMTLKRKHVELMNKPHREVVQLKKAVVNYKPKSVHSHEVEYATKKKEEGKKARLDEGRVRDMLFKAFEEHQYYNIKDLVSKTQQPVTYLKEILKDICVYNIKAPHRNMWELKPEYRHYKAEESSSGTT